MIRRLFPPFPSFSQPKCNDKVVRLLAFIIPVGMREIFAWSFVSDILLVYSL